MHKRKSRILVVAAHPDDEVLGAGGTLARCVAEGCEVYTLLLGDGETSRQEGDSASEQSKMARAVAKRKAAGRQANRLLGVKEVFFHHFPDNRFDSVPLLDIVKVIEEVKSDLRPEVIFTHFKDDLNVDHRITYQAVVTATRPVAAEPVKEIYSFEVLSSTEWNWSQSFSPDVFFDVSQFMEKKIKALSCYKSEMRPFPHPRSLKGVRLHAQDWGMKVGLDSAEAFATVRCVR